MRYYPICLNITNKRCVVAGGGKIGERKSKRLLECGAKVVVVSRKLTPALEKLKKEGNIDHIATEYDDACLDRAFLVIGATDDDEVNKRISEDAGKRGILVNIADDAAKCDFILPSIVEQGDLVVAISTEGKSPALAKKLREDLEMIFGPEYGALLEIMGQVRENMLAAGRSPEENKEMLNALVRSDILSHIKGKNREQVTNCIRDITGLDVELTGDYRGKG